MKLTKIQLGLFSIVIAWLSCFLFALAVLDLVTDGEYRTGIHASPYHDTPALGIFGAVSVAVLAGVAHLVCIALFVLFAFIRRSAIVIDKACFLVNFGRINWLKTTIQLAGYLLSAFWLWDFVVVTDVKFFGSQLLFSTVAVLVTWIYTLWGLAFLNSLARA